MNKIKLIILPFILSSCSVLPLYKIERSEYCEREYYDKICEGKRDGYIYNVRSVYDE